MALAAPPDSPEPNPMEYSWDGTEQGLPERSLFPFLCGQKCFGTMRDQYNIRQAVSLL